MSKAKGIYVGVPTQVPIYEGTDVPLTNANIDKYFQVFKDNGTVEIPRSDMNSEDYLSYSGDFTVSDSSATYNSVDIEGTGSSTGAEISGTFDVVNACFVRILTSTLEEVHVKINGDDKGVNWDGDVSSGDTITITARGDSSNPDFSLTISITDNTLSKYYEQGTPGNFTISDNASGGLKLVPGIFGEDCVYCTLSLKAKQALTDVKIFGQYYTEGSMDPIEVEVGGQTLLNDGGEFNYGQIGTTQNLAAGQIIWIKYSKDHSVSPDNESSTYFVVTCDPISEQTITGYETKNVARRVKSIYVGAPTQVPIYGGTNVPLTVANINKYFTVAKDSGELSGDFTDYFTVDHDECGASTNYNSAWGTYDTAGVVVVTVFSVTATTDMSSVSLTISRTGNALGAIKVDGTAKVAIGGDTTLDSSCDLSITSGSTIDVHVLRTTSDGDSISFDIVNNDASAPGNPADWAVSDNTSGGLKLVPGIFGEPLTYCEVTLTAKTSISNVVLSGQYYTESSVDKLTVKLNDTYILNDVSGNSGLAERWSGNLTSGDKMYLYYSKDQSIDNPSETDTAFFISCDPLVEETIVGYETKPRARKVKKIYNGVDNLARLCYSEI